MKAVDVIVADADAPGRELTPNLSIGRNTAEQRLQAQPGCTRIMAAMIALEPWLVLDRITVAYGRKSVVQALSITLQVGSIGCLLGPSGCGKTTVLRAILRQDDSASRHRRL